MLGSIHRAVARGGALAPRGMLRGGLRATLRDGVELSLCLHRVGRPRGEDLFPELTAAGGEITALIELLLGAVPARGRWLTVCFDDGYLDAVEWVEAQAPRFPEVQFLIFVCPLKVETREGFAWDLAALERRHGATLGEARALAERGARADPGVAARLAGVADLPDSRLATLAELRAARGHPNVALGDHTDGHFEVAALGREAAQGELRRSRQDFVRLFGEAGDFAFPYGVPGRSYTDEHLGALRALDASRVVWSTASRPFRALARSAGVALPRVALDGRWGHRGMAAWILERAVAWRARERRAGT